MELMNTQSALIEFCARASQAPYVTIDTEFIRENTFYAELCLVQIAFPKLKGEENDDANAAVVDVLAEDINLAPLLEIFQNENIVKVFHAARQDLEIFYHDYGILPRPFFDTQVAAMVDGYGDQVGYETLVRSIAKGKIDKSSRFTDWSRRPLTNSQLEYAKADVTYLRQVYEHLDQELKATGRMEWVREEFEALLVPELYDPPADESWQRVRSRINTPKFLAYVRELATFREEYARKNNIPRNRVFKDDALLEAAAQKPKSVNDLRQLRLWRGGVKADIGQGVLEAISRAEALSPKQYPPASKKGKESTVPESLFDLLRVYLKAQAEQNGVAQRLICTTSELEEFAEDPASDSPLNRGWRSKVFGEGAKALLDGKAGLMANGKYVKLVNKGDFQE